jgi:2-oxoglutarate dehydrogenase E2 component (dihydrolipoamide succinyltransferase)
VDVSQINGTGEGGRVTKKDILAYIESTQIAEPASAAIAKPELAPWEYPSSGELFRPSEETGARNSQPASAEPGLNQSTSDSRPAPKANDVSGEVVPLSNMRRVIAEHMVRSVQTSPHVTTVWEADCSRIVAHREANKVTFERDGARLTYTPYFVSAVVKALKQHPLVNSSWSENGIALHRQVNVGVAVSLSDEGLIVPVIKNADSMNLLGLARAVNDLADRARRKQLKPDETQGGTFSITNHGTLGGLFATPIIHQPQCAILGVGKIEKRAVVVTLDSVDALAIKPMVYLSLSFDHRILDGASADNFMAKLKQALEGWSE